MAKRYTKKRIKKQMKKRKTGKLRYKKKRRGTSRRRYATRKKKGGSARGRPLTRMTKEEKKESEEKRIFDAASDYNRMNRGPLGSDPNNFSDRPRSASPVRWVVSRTPPPPPPPPPPQAPPPPPQAPPPPPQAPPLLKRTDSQNLNSNCCQKLEKCQAKLKTVRIVNNMLQDKFQKTLLTP